MFLLADEWRGATVRIRILRTGVRLAKRECDVGVFLPRRLLRIQVCLHILKRETDSSIPPSGSRMVGVDELEWGTRSWRLLESSLGLP